MKALFALILMTLAACSSGHYEVSHDAGQHVDMTFVGIPAVAGELGTTTPLTESISITAKHVAHHMVNNIIAESPDCDIALIQHDNHGKVLPKLRNPNLGESVTLYGYSARTALPVEGHGVIVQNYHAPKSEYQNDKCIVTTTTAGGVQGNSGGAFVDKDGNLVGIMIAVNTGHDGSFNTVMVPYLMFKELVEAYK